MVGLLEVGKAVDRLNMICVRCVGGDGDATVPTVKAVADQCLPFEVGLASPTRFAEAEVRFELGVG